MGSLKTEFIKLLERNPPEEIVQQHLNQNPVLLAPDAVNVYPKVKLGSQLVTDFVIDRGGGDYVLVEIEPPAHALFVKSGDPSSKLTHAERQILDWQEWMRDNLAYARDNIPELTDVHDPEYWLIIGRTP